MKRRVLHWLGMVALCCWHMGAAAQHQLVLEKPQALKRQPIHVGDEIGIRVRGMDKVYVGELRGVKDSLIFMFGDSLDPGTFDRIYLPRERYWTHMTRGALVMAAVLYPVMMVLNLPRDQWTWGRVATVAGVSVGALALQQTLKLRYWRKIRLGGKWRLRILPWLGEPRR